MIVASGMMSGVTSGTRSEFVNVSMSAASRSIPELPSSDHYSFCER
jgi:hypothetical protein